MKKLLLPILLLSITWTLNASTLQKTIDDFFCSDDIQTISDTVSFPIFLEFRQSTYTKSEFIKGIKKARQNGGNYKLGKACLGYKMVILKISNNTVKVITGDAKMKATIYLNDQGKIIGVHTN